MEKQVANTLLMVRPANFGYNEETAENNAFQVEDNSLSMEEVKATARIEFDLFVDCLRSAGIRIVVVDDSPSPVKTDAVFPNNWFSTHEEGWLVTYPMFSVNRRLERRDEVINMLKSEYHIKGTKDYTAFENENLFLEGTGSMILDRPGKVVYACLSVRTDKALLEKFGRDFGYEIIDFRACDKDDIPYYHTNVIMTLGRKLAILCTESIENISKKNHVIDRLKEGGREILDISRKQVQHYAGNMLEVLNQDGQSIMIMSSQAYKCLTLGQINIIQKFSTPLHSPLDSIEKYGGGSARCMLAEIFFEKKCVSNCL